MVLTDRRGIKDLRKDTEGLQIVAQIGNLFAACEKLVKGVFVDNQINDIRIVAGVRTAILRGRGGAKQFVRIVQLRGIGNVYAAPGTLIHLHAIAEIAPAWTSHRCSSASRCRNGQKAPPRYFFL